MKPKSAGLGQRFKIEINNTYKIKQGQLQTTRCRISLNESIL